MSEQRDAPASPGTRGGRTWLERRPRKEDARGCYRYILGRDPEDEAVLEGHAANAATIAELRTRFLASEEFRQALLAGLGPEEGPEPEVDLAASEKELDRMLLWQLRLWGRLGEEAPHWSVLPDDRFRPERLEANRKDFLASGAGEVAKLLSVLARAGIEPGEVPHLVEHGCGVGRLTVHLAAHFPEITGLDVSQTHLAVARRELRKRGLVHLRWARVKEGEPMPAAGYDIWYSRRVLQWNPPPLSRRILSLGLAGLRPGGVAVFQLPTWRAGYRFSTAEYLAKGRQPDAPDLHLLPQQEVFVLTEEAGMRVLGVWEDSHLAVPAPSPWRSQLFVLRKPR